MKNWGFQVIMKQTSFLTLSRQHQKEDKPKRWLDLPDNESTNEYANERTKVFLKIGLPRILSIAILHQCAKFHEKIKSAARKIQEIPFFPGENWQFRLQKSVLLTIEPFLMMDIVINNIFEWKNNEIKGKSPMKICKNCEFRHISGIFGLKKIFLKNLTQSCFEHC